MMQRQPYTLITGASSGLGREFAIQCARMGRNLLLFDLPGSQAPTLAEYLRLEFRIDAQSFEFDLTDSVALTRHALLITELYAVDFLINNAGVGGTSSITATSFEKIDQIIQLNVRSLAQLTHLLLPHLMNTSYERRAASGEGIQAASGELRGASYGLRAASVEPKAFILNVSSMAAFTPIAYKTVYPASKAFISSFSLGLREELAGTGVSVSVLYPGPMMTNYNTSRRILSQGRQGQMGLLSTAAIVRMALNKTFAGQPVIIPGWMNRMSQLLLRVLPAEVKLKIVSRAVRKEIAYG